MNALEVYGTRLMIVLAIFFLMAFQSVPGNNGAFVAISATSKAAMQKGYGIITTLVNQDTKKEYTTKSLGPISAHSIIANIPAGTYLVTKVVLPLGEYFFENKSDSLQTFFGELKFEEGKRYYLGNFTGIRTIGMENVFRISIEDEEIPMKLIKKLRKTEPDLNESSFIKTYPYESKELMIF